jgi:hypothetical protein
LIELIVWQHGVPRDYPSILASTVGFLAQAVLALAIIEVV